MPDTPTPSFRRVAEVEVLKTHVFSVGQVSLLDPDGEPFERFIVHHPGAVAIIAVDANRRVTLVRQYRAAVDRMVLEAPAGTCDVDGEAPEATARRELAEEAGLVARVDGGPDRHLQHAGDQRPAHDHLLGHRVVAVPGPAEGRRGGLHDD